MNLNKEIELLNALLIKYGEGKWKLPSVNTRNDVTLVLGMFGGMGSLNDLYICKMNGHDIQTSEESKINNTIRQHLGNIHNGCTNFASKS